MLIVDETKIFVIIIIFISYKNYNFIFYNQKFECLSILLELLHFLLNFLEQFLTSN